MHSIQKHGAHGTHLPELVVVLLVLCNLIEELDALLDEVLLDDLEDLVLLEHLTGDVEGQILRVHNALDEAQPLGNQLLAVVHDEHPPHVQLDVVGLFPAAPDMCYQPVLLPAACTLAKSVQTERWCCVKEVSV